MTVTDDDSRPVSIASAGRAERSGQVGVPTPRVEDARFITGRGCYTDDVQTAGAAYACFVRSPHAHAVIESIDAEAARDAPGVLAVLTGSDAVADGIGDIPCRVLPAPPVGEVFFRPPYPILVGDRVRCVGDRVAMVVAETKQQAKDAAELVDVAYEALPSVVSVTETLSSDAPKVWEQADNNACFQIRRGDEAAVEEAFAQAAHVVKVTQRYPRIAGNTLEPRSSTGVWDRRSGRYTLYTGNGQIHRMKDTLAVSLLHVPDTEMHVIATDIGGGFGQRGALYPEDGCVLWASRKLGRPVKWTAERSESLMSDIHGRDRFDEGEAAFDSEGRILAVRANISVDLGAYLNHSAGNPAINASRLCSVYDVPNYYNVVHGVFTHTGPIGVYRGTGKPENLLFMEQLMDKAARQIGIDRIALRRRNLIPAAAIPYAGPGGYTIDCGEFERMLDRALELGDYNRFSERRAASEKSGLLRGLGIGLYILPAAHNLFSERMEIRVAADGTVAVHAGTQSSGQGHETMYTQMVSTWLGIPFEQIRIYQGDTDRVLFGRGTFSERSATMGGSALRLAADDLIAKGKRFAAWMLDANAEEIDFADGIFHVAGSNKSVTLAEIAQRCYTAADTPIELGVGLDGIGGYSGKGTFPNGCVVCEVEIDPETGKVTLDRCTSVCDSGTVINPLTITGQMHGSLCQAAGEMLVEQVRYDGDGQLITGSFADYAMPRADLLPEISTEYIEIPTQTNPLGVKGGSESGNAGGPGAVYNAILDALSPLGVTDVALPATPDRVWQAIQDARSSAG
jgi:carbon-monoxide dehydrogenase large subunit